MFHGKMKAVTFSYDDGVTQDQPLIQMFNRYGLKCTFNLNSGLLGRAGMLIRNERTVAHVKPRPSEIRSLYEGHEVASHTLTHPSLPKLDDAEVVRQVEEDRLALSELVGYEVVGMAYPGGGGPLFDARVADLIRRKTGIRYARTTTTTGAFDAEPDLFTFRPTVYHMHWDEMEKLAYRFLAMEPETPQLFYVWGHAYEFDFTDSWYRMEKFCQLISGHSDVFYGTNREVLLETD